MATYTSRGSATSDNCEQEYPSGDGDITSSDLELCNDKTTFQQYVACRTTPTIPQGATITSAYYQFTADEADDTSVSVTIYGEDADNSAAYTEILNAISNRTFTTASVSWSSIPEWVSAGDELAAQKTPDLKTIVQEIVNRSGWSSGNGMSIIFEPVGTAGDYSRVADSYDGDPATAPEITIVYSTLTHYDITAAQGSYALTGQAATIEADRTLTLAQGTHTLTGQTTAILYGRTLALAQGSYTLTGYDAILDYLISTYTIEAAQGSYALTGQATALLASRIMVAAQGSYALTGQTALLLRGYPLRATQGSYALSGQATSLLASRLLTAAQGSFTLTGQNVNVNLGYLLVALVGTYAMTGKGLLLIYSGAPSTPYVQTFVVPAEGRSLTMPASQRTYTVPADNRTVSVKDFDNG